MNKYEKTSKKNLNGTKGHRERNMSLVCPFIPAPSLHPAHTLANPKSSDCFNMKRNKKPQSFLQGLELICLDSHRSDY
jgi:hypothetical protein